MDRPYIIDELKQLRYKMDTLIGELEREEQAKADEEKSVDVAQQGKPSE